MLSKKKNVRSIAVTALRKNLPALLWVIAMIAVCSAAQAAMPGTSLNSNPFEVAQNALSKLIEGGISLGKWIAMAVGVFELIKSIHSSGSERDKFIKIGFILVALSGLSWIIELFLVV